MSIIGLYHKDCADGTTAAAVLLKRFPEARVFPLGHGYSEEDFAPIREAVDKDTTVYILDAAFGARELADIAKEVVVIDHHIGVKEDTEKLTDYYGNVTYVFNNDKSGASLAWEYFFSEEDEPRLVTLVEDMDLFRWRHRDQTKALKNYSIFFFNKPDAVVPYLSESIEPLLEKGRVLAEFSETLQEEYTTKADEAEVLYLRIGSHHVPAYNAAGFLRSELGNTLSRKHEMAVAMFGIRGNTVTFSLRSIKGQTPSALELAKELGGGGHETSSGARISLEEFCEMIVKN